MQWCSISKSSSNSSACLSEGQPRYAVFGWWTASESLDPSITFFLIRRDKWTKVCLLADDMWRLYGDICWRQGQHSHSNPALSSGSSKLTPPQSPDTGGGGVGVSWWVWDQRAESDWPLMGTRRSTHNTSMNKLKAGTERHIWKGQEQVDMLTMKVCHCAIGYMRPADENGWCISW